MAISNDGTLLEPLPVSSMPSTKDTTQPAKKKLHGRAFYESIGSPKFVLAPMVEQSEFAWRMLSRSFMSPSTSKDLLAYTPMLHARLFRETPKFRDQHFQPLRSSLISQAEAPSDPSKLFLDGNPSFDRPLFVQFCANDPEDLLKAAEYVAPFCDAVDLNLGCPQGIARKGKYGAFLQEDQDLVYSLINNLHLNLSVPVTAKIRILETKEKTLEYAQRVLSAGASILTVHGRRREQKGHNTGLADWGMIRYLRENLPKETVLIANGNILDRESIDRCIEATGVDGVMSAEGNLYDPAIFSEPPAVGEEGREYWRGNDGKGGWRMDAAMRRYMDIIYKYVLEIPIPERKPLYLPGDPVEPTVPATEEATEKDDGPPKKRQKTGVRSDRKERVTSPSLMSMQAHLFHLLRPLVAKYHPVRDALARSRAGDIAAFENVLRLVESAVAAGIREYVDTNGASYEEEVARDARVSKLEVVSTETQAPPPPPPPTDYESSLQTVKEHRRPWWVVQPYVRPLPTEALAKGSMTLSKKDKAKLAAEEAKAKKLDAAVEGRVETEVVGENGEAEKVDLPKDGLVSG